MTHQETKQLVDWFKGSDFNEELDGKRLRGQIGRIYNLMKDSKWRTLGEIEQGTGDPQASISAQLRNLRKPPLNHIVQKQRRVGGLWEYRLVPVHI